MTVSKRTRFEVLRRDNHACRYCGGSAPDVKLTVDHVMPVALGGSDDPTNLVTACKDCNAGKTSTSPSETLVADVAADALRWAKAMEAAADKMIEDMERRDALCNQFHDAWTSRGIPVRYLTPDWDRSVLSWLRSGFPMTLIIDSLDIAYRNPRVDWYGLFRYMAGIIYNRISELHDAVKADVEVPDGA